MLNISRKNKISWIVSCTIYAFFFMILFPFLILSVVTELNKTYDLYSIGVEGSSVALSLSPSSNTYKNAFETTLSVLTKESSNSLSISKDTMEMTAHNLTSDLAASLGVFVVSIIGDFEAKETSLIASTIVNVFTLPLVNSFYEKLINAENTNNVTEKSLVEQQIKIFFQDVFLQRFGTEEGFFASIASVSAFNSLEPLFTAEGFRTFQKAREPPSNNAVLTAKLDAAFGKAILSAYQIPSFDLASLFAKPYVDEIKLHTSNLIKYFALPVQTLGLIITISFAILCYWKREEPEIKSKYHIFLILLFLCIFLGQLLQLVANLVAMLTTHGVRSVTASLVGLFSTFYMLALCTLNCRHRLMYNLFVNHRHHHRTTDANFFFPLLWQLPVVLGTATAVFLAFETDVLTMKYGAICVILYFTFFAMENAFYIYQTRNAWNLFVDTPYNVRTLVAIYFFAIPCLCIIIFLISEPYQSSAVATVMVVFFNYIFVCYLCDSFILPLVKIFFREKQIDLLGSFSFVAQQKAGDRTLDAILDNKQLRTLLLETATAAMCDENVRFLIAYRELENDLTFENFEKVIDEFIHESAAYQLNLTSRAIARAMAGFERVKNKEKDAVLKDQVVYAFNLVEMEVFHLVMDNVMKTFLVREDVKEIFQVLNEKATVANRLASLGLVSPNNNSASSSTHRSTRARSGSRSQRDSGIYLCHESEFEKENEGDCKEVKMSLTVPV